jgi:hypothetical protein
MEHKPTYDLFCPICNRSVGVAGERTETYSQYVAYCKHCKCEFTVSYFKATAYRQPLYRAESKGGDA